MNKNKVNLYSCYQKDSNILDPIFQALDCFEQRIYLILKSRNISNPLFFCKSIVPIFVKYKNKEALELLRNNLWEEEFSIFKREDIPVYKNNYFESIKKIIDQGECVVFSTMFDLVYPYLWYDENSSGNHYDHFSTIVDYDEENYYVIDSPYVFAPTRNQICEFNKSISIIPMKYLHRGFLVYCNLFRLVLQEDVLYKQIDLITIIKKNVIDYNHNCCYELEEGIIFYGKSALIRLQECIKTSEFEILKQTGFSFYWDIHLILSRHILLRMCLIQEKAIFSEDNFNKILIQLNKCISLWNKLKNIIMKNFYKIDTSISFQKSVEKVINAIVQQEKKLFDELSVI